MGNRDHLGEFEQLVLLALLRLGDNAYGVTIRSEIKGQAGRATSLGAVYTTLERLEGKGYVYSAFGEATPERGGKPKRFFKIRASGASALRRSLAAQARMVRGLRPLLGGL